MESGENNPTLRFSSRVDDYVRYRPAYPKELITYLRETHGLTTAVEVAEIGSGTGIFTELLLQNGNRVFAVEPNDAMRAVAEQRLSSDPRFVSVPARAEHTTLPDDSVDAVVAAQSFHWFDGPSARREFIRILRRGGPVVLVWNARLIDTTPFLAEYEGLLRSFAIDYERVDHTDVEKNRLQGFFAPAGYSVEAFPNEQLLDFDGLLGRVRSSSYMPGPDHPRYPEMLVALQQLFDRHVQGGRVRIEYRTNVYCGSLA